MVCMISNVNKVNFWIIFNHANGGFFRWFYSPGKWIKITRVASNVMKLRTNCGWGVGWNLTELKFAFHFLFIWKAAEGWLSTSCQRKRTQAVTKLVKKIKFSEKLITNSYTKNSHTHTHTHSHPICGRVLMLEIWEIPSQGEQFASKYQKCGKTATAMGVISWRLHQNKSWLGSVAASAAFQMFWNFTCVFAQLQNIPNKYIVWGRHLPSLNNNIAIIIQHLNEYGIWCVLMRVIFPYMADNNNNWLR